MKTLNFYIAALRNMLENRHAYRIEPTQALKFKRIDLVKISENGQYAGNETILT